jgi:hypothetical protein
MERQSVTYRQLQTVLVDKPGCPVCHLGQEAGHHYLDGLLWESVNDPGVRDGLLDSLGFCGRHSRELLTFAGERLGIAIIQRAVLQEALRNLQDNPTAGGRNLLQRLQDDLLNRRDATGWAEEGTVLAPCPACAHQAEVEERALQELLVHLGADLAEPLQQAGGLCWPHLQQALRLCDAPATCTALVTMHRRLWSELVDNLSEFIRKKDHRFQSETVTGAERVAIDRSIAVLTGEYPIR